MNLRILYQDEHLVAIDKPAGFHVHPPEDQRHKIARSTNTLFLLRKQLERFLYPVHRIDRATSGVLLFALESEIAGQVSQSFQAGEVEKIYFAIVRGWTQDSGTIDHPLDEKPSFTRYETVSCLELPEPVGRYSTARFSLVKVRLGTGRMHQIRRHFAHLSHPLIGDTIYGDGKQNRFFRDRLGLNDLMLKAYSLDLPHPSTGERLRIVSRWNDSWLRAFEAFGVCPYEGREVGKTI